MSRHLLRAAVSLASSFAPSLPAQSPAIDSPPPPTVAACTTPALADTLVRAAAPALRARAHWISATDLVWPGAPADGRFALLRSARAAIVAAPGAIPTGADVRLPLERTALPIAPALAERFRWIGDGAHLRLPAPALRQLGAIVRDQLVLVREDADGRVLEATALQLPGVLDDHFAGARTAADLGAHPTSRDTRFALWAPTARQVSLCLFPDATGSSARLEPLILDPATGIWRRRVQGNLHGQGYLYLVDVMVPGAGLVRNRVTDPYAHGLVADSRRSVVIDFRHPATRSAGWEGALRPAPLAHATDLTVYELHVRDFSRGDTTVPAAWRGKFLAFTALESDGMRHLRALGAAGVTDVHLLPVYDLSTVPERDCAVPAIPNAPPASEAQQGAVSAVRERDCFNWGYDPFHYTTPEGSYTTDPDDAARRVREFRAMVQALHGVGLRVGLDVVYNHTFAAGQDAKSVLDRIVPGYYHRLDADGRVTRSTCCENTATEHAMMEKLMVESAVTWAREYRIDSFRFDLMGHQPRAAMERLQRAVDSAGRHIPLIGEGWDFGEVAGGARFVQASQRSLPGSGIATFSDRARDALRGGGCCDGGEGLVANQGLLNGLHHAPNLLNEGKDRRADLLRAADLARAGLAGTLRDYPLTGADGATRPLAQFDYAGGPAGYAAQPGEVVNYVENHDNLTLFDLNALRLPRDLAREQRARAQVTGIAFTLFSQGVAYLHAGVEILRSKSLDRDSFDSGDWFNRLDWTYRENGYGAGLPPAHRNQADWPWMRDALADARIAPTATEIRWTRDATLDLLRIRASSTLFRLRTADDVRARLRFPNTGPAQDPTVLAGHLDGAGYPGAAFREVLYLVNVAGEARSLTLGAEAGKAYVLHPVHRADRAADRSAREARYDAATGRFTIPARTAVVFVVE